MKKIYILLVFLACAFNSNSQTAVGPGGVGNRSNNLLWLDASRLGLANSASVSSWTDFSGNANHADQSTGSFQPTFVTASINGLPVVDFDGTDDRLELTSNILSDDVTIFIVSNTNNSGYNSIISINKHHITSRSNKIRAVYNPSAVEIAKPINSYSLSSFSTNSNAVTDDIRLTNGSTISNLTRDAFYNFTVPAIGAVDVLGTFRFFLEGQIAEIIVYDEKLDSASYNIVSDYLRIKYNVFVPNPLYSFFFTHPHNLKGVGQESDGSNTSARGYDSLLISNPSSLGNGDYLLVGHDNAGYTTSASVPSTSVERWSQVWRADVTGTPGTVDLEFFLNAGSFASPSDYTVLIETDDGDFSNGNVASHVTGRSYNAINNSIKFTGVSLSDGDYFTLGELQSDISAISDGLWKSTSTWSCGCIPVETDVISIGNTFDVTIDSNARALALTIDAGGTLTFSGTDTLDIETSLTIDGSITSGSGVLAATGSVAQIFTNTSGSTTELNSLFINNSSGLDLISGDWSISSNLQVSSGTLDVSGATSMTLTSTASSTSQILESVDNSLIGNFTVQRYIGARNANYGNITSPMESATVADLDDDLFISGVGGADGNATVVGGGIFYSMYSYHLFQQKHDTITSTTTELTPGKGFEIYLASTLAGFDATTIDYVGVPTVGDMGANEILVGQGWNLIGNPYHAFLSYDLIEKHALVPTSYYIFNTNNGSYDLFTGGAKPAIAPGQGFWVNKIFVGTNALVAKEEDKVSSSTSDFLRQKHNSNLVSLNISSLNNPYSHKTHFKFDQSETDNYNETDALLLPSPIKDAPAIYSFASNSKERLVLNSLSSENNSKIIPLSIYSGVNNGNYIINSENIEELYDSYSCAYLKDKVNNEIIDLFVEDKYEFSSPRGDHDRFNLILSNSFSDCQKLLETNKNGTQQGINNSFSLRNAYNNWFLDYTLDEDQNQIEIHIYNMQGQEVHNALSFNVSRSGSLIINDLNDLNGIYLIQVKSRDQILNKTIKL